MAIQVIKSDGTKTIGHRTSTLDISGTRTIYVDNLYGSDVGDGSASHPFKTLLAGFQSLPTSNPPDIRWVISNPAFRVNLSTGNNGTGARFGGAYQTIDGLLAAASYTSNKQTGDIIYVDAGAHSSTLDGMGASFLGLGMYFAPGCTLSSSATNYVFYGNGSYCVAGHCALTTNPASQSCRAVYAGAGNTYIQLDSVVQGHASPNQWCFEGSGGNGYDFKIWVNNDITIGGAAGIMFGYSGSGKVSSFKGRNVTYTGSSQAFQLQNACTFYVRIRSITAAPVTNTSAIFYTAAAGTLDVVVDDDAVMGHSNGNGLCQLDTAGSTLNYAGRDIICLGRANGDSSQIAIGINAAATANIKVRNLISFSRSYAIYTAQNGSVLDLTANKIIRVGSFSTDALDNPVIRLDAGTMTIRNAIIQGQHTGGSRGPILVGAGNLNPVTLNLYDCTVCSKSGTTFGSIVQTAASATVNYYGTCVISDAETGSVTINGSRTVNSAARYFTSNGTNSLALLSLNGPERATDFIDKAINNYGQMYWGSPQIVKTVGSPFSANDTALYLNGSSILVQANTNQYQVDTGDFTIEGWFYRTTTGADQFLFGVWETSTTGWGFICWNDNAFSIRNGNLSHYTGVVTIPINTWVHLALSRRGSSTNKMNAWMNGTQFGADNFNSTNKIAAMPAGARLYIGSKGDVSVPQNPTTGYISEVRFSNVSRYNPDSTSIVPPTSRFTLD